jgi:hypothetical protein
MSNQNEKKVYSPLAEGDYMVALDKFEEVATKAGNGSMVKCTYKVIKGLDENAKGRLIFESFLVVHPSEKAVEIGKSRLSKFVKSVGVAEDYAELGDDSTRLADAEGLPFIATVGIKPAEEYKDKASGEMRTSKPRNYIKKFTAR